MKYCITFLMLLFVVAACNNGRHSSQGENYQQKVKRQFEERKKMAAGRHEALFSVFEKKDLTLEQREALEFLYAYMPLCDLANYDGEFFLKQVDAAFTARDYFHWGKTIPEDIFRHFVLVYRVNNEYLDTARLAFFQELKDRVKGLSMVEAALEVNHWCHEKVTYRATDGRTSAPLALVKTSWGRCGEESTFTVTALRAVGIPARQCYTPRWVHTNDNHAWVEVWIDGTWHYLGACEPEPELDMAWFTAPAKRAMMVHTNVFGLYEGPEEKNRETPLYSIINLLENYAPVRRVNVKIIDEEGLPVNDAKVTFKVYNYAELYPVAERVTASDGTASIISGMGDVIIWANKGDRFGYEKSAPEDEVTVLTLHRTPTGTYHEEFTMNPPGEQPGTEVSSEKIAANNLRLLYEDSIRNAYMNTFASGAYAYDIAVKTRLEPKEVQKYLQTAQGNWKDISFFIQSEKDNPYLLPFLATLSEKDLRDTPMEYLEDHLREKETLDLPSNLEDDIIVKYILSPRISLELIRPWRSFFQRREIMEEIAGSDINVAAVMDYTRKNIEIKDAENYYNCLLTPQGVYELKMADRRSRDIFFVAACRSYNIPARIETATGRPQYYEKGEWIDVLFDEKEREQEITAQKAELTLKNDPENTLKPDYYIHYTLAFFQDGDFRTLDYEDDPAVKKFPYTLNLDEGYYRLMTGSRANDGSVTVHVDYFELKADNPQTVTVKLPEIVGKLFVYGSVDMNTVVRLNNNNKKSLKELDNGKGLMLCFIDPGKEPSKHLLQDFPAQKEALQEWGGGILLMIPGDLNTNPDISAFRNLPKQTRWGVDYDRSLLKTVSDVLQINFRNDFPLTVYLSTNGGVLYYSTGYRLGISEEVLKTIHLEAESLK